jgi:hypothetical protein
MKKRSKEHIQHVTVDAANVHIDPALIVVERLRTCIEDFYNKFPGSRAEPPVYAFNEHDLVFAAIAICDLFGVDEDDDDACQDVEHILKAASHLRPVT